MSKQTAPTITAMGAALMEALPDGKLENPALPEKAGFKKLLDLRVEVPKEWKYANAIDAFVKKFQSKTFKVSPGITDDNFSSVTYGLLPGAKYRVRAFTHIGATTEECLAFLAQNNALLVGPQGLALVAGLNGYELLMKHPNHTVVSFCEERACPSYADGTKVLGAMSETEFGFVAFHCTWPRNYVVLCITRIG